MDIEKDNLNLYYSYIHKMRVKIKDNRLYDDLCYAVLVGYLKGCNSYDSSKGNLSTLCRRCMDNEYIRYFKQANTEGRKANLNTVNTLNECNKDSELDSVYNIEDATNDNELICLEDDYSRLYELMEELPEDDRDIVQMYYMDGKKLREIAQKYDVTTQYISWKLKNIVLNLKNNWNK